MTAAAISGGTAATITGAASHPTAGCAFVSTTLETEYGEYALDVLCTAGGAFHWIRRAKHQDFELVITTFAVIFVNGHQPLL
jgi:hypothetical protein